MARSWTRRGEWIETALPAVGGSGGAEAADRTNGRGVADPAGETGADEAADEPSRPAPAAAGPEALAAAALGVPERLARRLLAAGEVQVRGGRAKLRLRPDEPFGFEPVWTEDGLEALYEDDFCLVVRKPAGMPVHPDGGGAKRATLANLVAAHYQLHGEQCAVHHVHRLDEYTSGPVLYAKGEFSRLALDAQMREKAIGRVYLAVAAGKVPPALRVIDAPIGRDRHHKSRRRVSPGGQEAVTRVERLEVLAGGRASLVRLVLETGRTHQIRVHMSHAGYPLIGDTLYGGPADPLNRQALHGEKLSFAHPFTGGTIEVDDPLPDDMRALLDRLT
ncbi:RluA family pseudouridine synthase [Saccharibacillus sp. CPCC 101409]|uniref:RluA family pseudouridine synthase n=1 Tax=Saccharibacillus sp. CPCC 101409 TaxID=3058041 RepID=UPI0026724E6B|nr:RluA family pseudouridine synthase [Saccharibacillus sp. CPCC 101409]MDO3410195.1 RluA family pseudouridine synthase [Saccharibacillus sp. CPCC 101409]